MNRRRDLWGYLLEDPDADSRQPTADSVAAANRMALQGL
jgi:hypothetical protein